MSELLVVTLGIVIVVGVMMSFFVEMIDRSTNKHVVG